MSQRYRCLLAEDSAMMRKLLTYALGRVRGMHVVEVEDGAEALREVSTRRYDLVITDINMPILDGLTLVERMRENSENLDTPVLVITGDDDVAEQQRAMDLGANAVLIKPVKATHVIDAVTRLTGATVA